MGEGLVTILSIDGGGVRGVIPGYILAVLEAELQVTIFLSAFLPSLRPKERKNMVCWISIDIQLSTMRLKAI